MAEWICPASVGELNSFSGFLEGELQKHDVPLKTCMQVQVAAEEIFVNVAHYAYPEKEGTVRITVEITGCQIRLCFEDSGIPFDPLAKSDPDITLSAEERKIGGLGIYMVKKSMDRVEYEYRDQKNILTLYKSF